MAALAPRPRRMRGQCALVRTHFGNLTVDVHEDPVTGEPVEVIASAGTAGSDLMADAVALGIAVSLLLRLASDVPARERLALVADKFRNIGGARSGSGGPGAAASLAQGLARGIDAYLGAPSHQATEADASSSAATPFELGPTCGSGSFGNANGNANYGWSMCS